MTQRILIACIGNIFLGDDGFGTEVARRLAMRPLPPEVTLKDFGIRGLDLTYALLDPYDLVLLIDTCPRGGEPGSLYVIEPEPVESVNEDGFPAPFEAHSMNPASVLRAVRAMGGAPGRILIVGCEPAEFGADDEGRLGLSRPVEDAVAHAVILIEEVVSKALAGEIKEIVSQSHEASRI